MQRAIEDFLAYDPETGVIRWKQTFAHVSKGDLAGVWNHTAGTRIITLNRVQYRTQTLAWFLYYGVWPEATVLSIDGDRANTRINNLTTKQPKVRNMCLSWISWSPPTEDYRPLTSPPNADILGWWKTGESLDGKSTLVAMVKATNVEDARAIILKDWPKVTDWRFCLDKKYAEISDRFPLSPWAKERIDEWIEQQQREKNV